MPPKPGKHIFKTSSPFSETVWPKLTRVEKDNILDLLCSLLQPLGDYRRTHITPSKGKKRKRSSKRKQIQQKHQQPDISSPEVPDPVPPPPPPEIGSHVLIGLNSVTRHLEALAAQTTPSHLPGAVRKGSNDGEEDVDTEGNLKPKPRPLSIVILPLPYPPSSLAHAHIPTLIHLANLNITSTTEIPSSNPFLPSSKNPNPNPFAPSSLSPKTRLLVLPTATEPRLSTALHIPHVGALAIMDGAPGADALVKYVRENVGLTRCTWIDEAMRAEWKGVVVK
ncbi:hypothetical protein CC80DRAFT_200097 [Byssothecium circinans]|uniref:Uncharacterized protein n=1 Tax=Byssothecium circinans TaxID=147558 RepID=A0A6A5UC65_9PLEO|nr:hypothetical protein CC80DRAFT_200097 [Byssothecium circinans]